MWIASAHLTQATGQVLRKAGAARGTESGGVAPPPLLVSGGSSLQDSTPVRRSSPPAG